MLAGIAFMQSAMSQDIILLRTADEIRATVLEVGETEVCYRNYGDNNGPMRRIGRDKILRITYANGEKETFADVASSSDSASDVSYPYPAVSRRYAVGDLFSEGDVQGVVVAVDAEGRHGLIMSLLGDCLAYGTPLAARGNTGALICSDADDGWRNMVALEASMSKAGLSLDNFPAYAWCRSLGKGWYLPAINELKVLAQCVLSQNEPKTLSDITRICKWVNNISMQYGGEDSIDWFFRTPMLWSSTEVSENFAYPLAWSKCKAVSSGLGYPSHNPNTEGYVKNAPLHIRAFHKF